MKNKLSWILIPSLLSNFGCGITKNMDEMNATTVKMAETTQKMVDLMGEMKSEIKTTNKEVVGMSKKLDTTNKSVGEMGKKLDKTNQGLIGRNGMSEQMGKMTGLMEAGFELLSGEMKGMHADLKETNTEMKGMRTEVVGEIKQMGTEVSGMSNKLTDTNLQVQEATKAAKHIDSLVDHARQGVASLIREQSRDQLESHSDMADKISEASKYFMAFEIQLYSEGFTDTPEKLDMLVLNAVEELIRHSQSYFSRGWFDDDRQRMLNPNSNDDVYKNLAALALTMDAINPNAELAADRTRTPKPRNMLSIIQEVLEKKAEINQNVVHAKLHKQRILDDEALLVYMIQVRASWLAGIILQRLTSDDMMNGIKEKNWLSLIDDLFLSREGHGFDVDLGTRTPARLESCAFFLAEANRNLEWLSRYGHPAKVDNLLARAYRQAKLIPSGDPARDEAEKKLLEQIEKFKQHPANGFTESL